MSRQRAIVQGEGDAIEGRGYPRQAGGQHDLAAGREQGRLGVRAAQVGAIVDRAERQPRRSVRVRRTATGPRVAAPRINPVCSPKSGFQLQQFDRRRRQRRPHPFAHALTDATTPAIIQSMDEVDPQLGWLEIQLRIQ